MQVEQVCWKKTNKQPNKEKTPPNIKPKPSEQKRPHHTKKNTCSQEGLNLEGEVLSKGRWRII